MPFTDLNSATTTDFTNAVGTFQITAKATDGATGQKETTYVNGRGTIQFGYFNAVPDLKSAILMKATWNVGKGWTADPETTVILQHIRGWGKDTFDDILFNMEVTKRIYGDAYCEIIRDTESGELLNLKPLDPTTIRIVVNEKGILERYEQIAKGEEGRILREFKPEEIFHLCNNRVADQIHGISDIDVLQDVIDAEQENFQDMRKGMHHQVIPLILWKLKTDDTDKIAAFKGKIEQAKKYKEDLMIPDDEAIVTHEVVEVNPSQIIMEWRNDLKNKFYRALGMPMIVFGSAGTTESGGKIEYLAHEQVFEKDQRHIEQQIWNQLFLKINLYPPTSLLENIQQDENKDAQNALSFQQSDVTAGSGR